MILLLALVLVALLRAEQGVAELQGRASEPSRLVRLVPVSDGAWRYAFLGYEGELATRVILWDTEGPLVALPEAFSPPALEARFAPLLHQMKRALPWW